MYIAYVFKFIDKTLTVMTTFFIVEYTTYIVLFLHSQDGEIRHSESLKCRNCSTSV